MLRSEEIGRDDQRLQGGSRPCWINAAFRGPQRNRHTESVGHCSRPNSLAVSLPNERRIPLDPAECEIYHNRSTLTHSSVPSISQGLSLIKSLIF